MICILNALLAFLAGTIGFGILSLLLILITIGLNDFEDYFFLLALPILFAPLYEELGKYLSIKIWEIETFYGFFFGFGWGLTESVITYINREFILFFSIPIHIITAIVICYFIKRKKPVLGLITAIVLHVGYNFFIATIA